MTHKLVFFAACLLVVLAMNTTTYADSMPLNVSERTELQPPAPDTNLRHLALVKGARLVPKDKPAFLMSSGGFMHFGNSSSSSSSEGHGGNGNPTPEPLSMILLGTGLAGVAAALRKSRS